jgi:hypothetical protein
MTLVLSLKSGPNIKDLEQEIKRCTQIMCQPISSDLRPRQPVISPKPVAGH